MQRGSRPQRQNAAALKTPSADSGIAVILLFVLTNPGRTSHDYVKNNPQDYVFQSGQILTLLC